MTFEYIFGLTINSLVTDVGSLYRASASVPEQVKGVFTRFLKSFFHQTVLLLAI